MDVLVYLGVGFIVGSAAGIGASQHLREKQMHKHQVYLEQVLQEANYNLDRNFDLRLEKSISHLQDEQQQKYHLYDQHLKEQESRLQSQIVTWQSDYQSYVQQELSNSNDQQNTRLQEIIQSLQGDYDNQLKKLVSDWKKSQNARLQEWERRLNIRLEDLTQQNESKLQDALNILQNQRGEQVLEELGKVEKVYENRLQDQINLLRQEYNHKLQEQIIGLTDRFNDKYNTWQNTWQNSFTAWEAKQDIKLQQNIKQVEEGYQWRIEELIKSLQQEQKIQLKQTQAELEANYQERLQASLTILQTDYEEHIRQLIEQRSVNNTASTIEPNITDTISHTIEGYQLAEDLPADQLNSVNNSNNPNNYNNSHSLDNNTALDSDSLDEPARNGVVYSDSLVDQLVNPTPVDWEQIEPESSKSVDDQNFNLVNPDYITNGINGTNGNYVNGVNSVNNTNGKYYTNGTNGTNGTAINISQLTPIISDTGESTVLTPSLSAISWDEDNSYENVLVKSPELNSNGIAHRDFNDSLNTGETTTTETEAVNNNENDYPLILLFTRLILFVGICGVVLDNVKKETEQEKHCDVTSLPIDLI